jgi:hypothetical protein
MTSYQPPNPGTVQEWAEQYDAERPENATGAMLSLVEAAMLLGDFGCDDTGRYYGCQALAEVALWMDHRDGRATSYEDDGDRLQVTRTPK